MDVSAALGLRIQPSLWFKTWMPSGRRAVQSDNNKPQSLIHREIQPIERAKNPKPRQTTLATDRGGSSAISQRAPVGLFCSCATRAADVGRCRLEDQWHCLKSRGTHRRKLGQKRTPISTEAGARFRPERNRLDQRFTVNAYSSVLPLLSFIDKGKLYQAANRLGAAGFVHLFRSPGINSPFQIGIQPQADRLTDTRTRPSATSFFVVINY